MQDAGNKRAGARHAGPRQIIFAFVAALCSILIIPPFVFSATTQYQRIVSLAPSVTEILFALNLQDRLVGVTRFCLYPPQARQKTKIGGLLDTNYEMIYRLHPDLIILESNQSDQKAKLEKMGFSILGTETKSVRLILQSIHLVGETFGQQRIAGDLIDDINKKIEDVKTRTEGMSRPRVLVTFERVPGEGQIRQAYVAGNDTFFSDLIELAGGQNAYQGPKLITSPILTAEGILHMNPDVIIEVMPISYLQNFSLEEALNDWKSLGDLKAFQDRHIYILTQDYLTIPGPRVGQALMDLAKCIHPEKFSSP